MLNWWQELQPPQLAFSFGGFEVYWYGIILTIAIVASYFLARHFYLKDHQQDKLFDDTVFWVIILGIVGARIFHVFVFQWAYYSNHLSEIFKIWQGGIAIQGAVVFGLLTLYFLSKKKNFSFFKFVDYLIPSLALGQALGRWGNFFNQELYGSPTISPLGIYISPEHRLQGFEDIGFYHPVFLYESVLNLVLFGLLLLARKKVQQGQLLALYLIGYGVIRFSTAMYKIDPHPVIFNLRLSQYIALIFALAGLYIWNMRKVLPNKED